MFSVICMILIYLFPFNLPQFTKVKFTVLVLPLPVTFGGSQVDVSPPFSSRELRACTRASYRYDVGNGIRSLARSIGRFL